MGEEVMGLAPSGEGKRRPRDASSIRSLVRGGGQQMVAPGSAAPTIGGDSGDWREGTTRVGRLRLKGLEHEPAPVGKEK
jgi:hypothetical protein